MDPYKIGKIIKKIRTDNKMTQEVFASKFGITYQAVSKWETGKSVPDIGILKNICSEYNIDINSLLDNKEKKVFNKKLVIPIIFVLIASLFLILSIIIYKNSKEIPNYEFKNIVTSNENFSVEGVASYSDNKQSLYIANIKYSKDEIKEYKNITCTLYVEKGNTITNISEVKSESAINNKDLSSINELLNSVSFKIDNYANVCKHNDNHYIKIEATNKDDKVISYTIPLLFEDTCD